MEDSTTQGTKTISIRVDEELVDEFDRVIVQAKADGELPMDYNRSEAVRDFFSAVSEDPEVIFEVTD